VACAFILADLHVLCPHVLCSVRDFAVVGSMEHGYVMPAPVVACIQQLPHATPCLQRWHQAVVGNVSVAGVCQAMMLVALAGPSQPSAG
jgi:hypothetical protein